MALLASPATAVAVPLCCACLAAAEASAADVASGAASSSLPSITLVGGSCMLGPFLEGRQQLVSRLGSEPTDSSADPAEPAVLAVAACKRGESGRKNASAMNRSANSVHSTTRAALEPGDHALNSSAGSHGKHSPAWIA
jgi:hypothetical protein